MKAAVTHVMQHLTVPLHLLQPMHSLISGPSCSHLCTDRWNQGDVINSLTLV
jgi:hypothetical protein